MSYLNYLFEPPPVVQTKFVEKVVHWKRGRAADAGKPAVASRRFPIPDHPFFLETL